MATWPPLPTDLSLLQLMHEYRTIATFQRSQVASPRIARKKHPSCLVLSLDLTQRNAHGSVPPASPPSQVRERSRALSMGLDQLLVAGRAIDELAAEVATPHRTVSGFFSYPS